jgi:hypothetical protein
VVCSKTILSATDEEYSRLKLAKTLLNATTGPERRKQHRASTPATVISVVMKPLAQKAEPGSCEDSPSAYP